MTKRLDEQAAEIGRLQRFETGYAEARQQLAEVERLLRPELDKKTSEVAKLEEEARLCQGVMARAAIKELGIELQSAAKGASLRDVVGEFVAAFGVRAAGFEPAPLAAAATAC